MTRYINIVHSIRSVYKIRFHILGHCSVDPASCGSTDDTFVPSLSALPSSSGQEYHLVHISSEDLTDVHSGGSPTNPPPIVINRKRSSPTGSASSSNSREGETSPTGSAGKYYTTHTACNLHDLA